MMRVCVNVCRVAIVTFSVIPTASIFRSEPYRGEIGNLVGAQISSDDPFDSDFGTLGVSRLSIVVVVLSWG
jgi:hypothetical protein